MCVVMGRNAFRVISISELCASLVTSLQIISNLSFVNANRWHFFNALLFVLLC